MDTVCHKQLSFGSLFGKQITADFDGSHITSDAGGLLLRELDQRYGLTDGIADSLYDRRHLSWVIHDLKSLIKQRIFSIALGYDDNNDAQTLRSNPALKTISGRLPQRSEDLASPPTLCRFENSVSRKNLRKLADWLFELYLIANHGPREVIVIDIDATPTIPHTDSSSSVSSAAIMNSTCTTHY